MKHITFITLLLFSIVINVHAQNKAWEARTAAKVADNAAFKQILSLWFLEAETGNALTGASVTIDGVGTFTTDSDGLIQFDTPADKTYSFKLYKEGYCELNDKFDVRLGRIPFYRYSVPKALNLENVRLVLDWGATPSDLDLHLVKYGNNGYHISYRDMVKSADGKVWLDRDDVDSYGPETITITENDNSANYLVFVHNYSDGGNSSSRRLSESGAVLRVYNNNSLVYTARLHGAGSGIYWNVINIERGQVKPIGTYSASQLRQ